MSIFFYVGVGNILKKHKPRIDNLVFHLHYRVTFLIFLITSLIVTAKEFVGVPMQCESKANNVQPLLNTYCYIMSTFSLPANWYWNTIIYIQVGRNTPYIGLGTPHDESELRFHSYYLWVPFMLFFQAMMFYSPHLIWKKIENGIFESVIDGLHMAPIDFASRQNKYKALIKYMMECLHGHKIWAYGFFVCEALNLVNVVGNIYFTNYFLGGTFLSYGTEVMNFPEIDPENRVDPMTRIFPKMAKCTFRKFGASGTLEVIDAFCTLPINIINEKVYIFIWFWLVILTVVTALWLIYRLATLASGQLRNQLLSVRGRMAGKSNLKIIMEKCDMGDWFLLYQLGCHMEPSVYGEFLKEFSKELENNLATLERKPMLMSN